MQLYSSLSNQETVLAGDSSLTIYSFDTSQSSVQDFVNEHIKHSDFHGKDDAFYIVNLGDVVRKFHLWREKLPRVEPFYGKLLPSTFTIPI